MPSQSSLANALLADACRLAQALGHDLEQAESELRIALEELQKGSPRDRHREHGGLGDDGRGARTAVEKRELSERVSRTELDALPSGQAERRLPIEDDEKALSRLAFRDDGRVRSEAPWSREIRDPLDVTFRERGEQGDPAQDVDPFRAERLPRPPGSRTQDELVDSDLPHRPTISPRAG